MTASRERNLEVSRRLVDIYTSEGPWAVAEHFDEFFAPDFRWRPAVSALGDEMYVGKDGYGRWQRDMEAIADEAVQTDFEVSAVGDRIVLVLSRMRLVGKGSQVPTESEYGAVYEMEEGRGMRGRAFLSHEMARRTAREWAGEAD